MNLKYDDSWRALCCDLTIHVSGRDWDGAILLAARYLSKPLAAILPDCAGLLWVAMETVLEKFSFVASS